jgi:hypothetical protein
MIQSGDASCEITLFLYSKDKLFLQGNSAPKCFRADTIRDYSGGYEPHVWGWWLHLTIFCYITTCVVLMTKFDNILLYQIYLITSDIFIRFQNFDTGFRLDISDLGRTYHVSDIFNFRSGSRALALVLGRIYRSRSHIFEVSDISDQRSGFRTVTTGFGRIYLTQSKSAELDSRFEG